MINEDYLPCSQYENQPAHAVELGFSAFLDATSSQYFFAMLDADGKVLLKSEGYPQQAARENGIQSVIKNRINRDFYSVKSEDGKYFLSLRAANYREIARSCSCDSEAEALALLPYVTGDKIRGGQATAMAATKERANDKVDDDYLACKEYEGHSDVGIDGYSGLVKFTHANGQHYFAWYDDDNALLMRSEGYPTTAARDNGMASVSKNRDLEERYAVLEKFSRYFTILKAGNHQEIARSCPYDTEGGAMALYPDARAKAAADKAAALADAAAAAEKATAEKAAALAAATAATVAAATVVADPERREDNYLHCREYENHGSADANGFTKWQYKQGEHYFTWLTEGGAVKMRSEGYPTTAARNNGVDSVIRNRDNKDRYDIIEKSGKQFVILKAGNHQEIARSCPKDDLAAVYALFPLLNPNPIVAAAEDVSVAGPLAAAAAVIATAAAVMPKPDAYVPPPPVYESATVAAADTAASGFKWWWLLLPLLALLAWWLFRNGCSKEPVGVAEPRAAVVTPPLVDTIKAVAPMAEPVAAAPVKSCNLNWIFFDFDKSDLRAASKSELDELVTILKDNKDYVALLKANTDWKGSDAYNEALSNRRAGNAKAYLVSKGIDASRIKTSINGEKDPVAKNEIGSKDSEAGRQFNRRVELYVEDKSGKQMCQSILPAIPADLKEK